MSVSAPTHIPQANRFDLLRLLFAAAVFVFHLVVLAQLAPEGSFEGQLAELAEISIQGFFIISGALVYGSYVRSKTLRNYAEKRVRRVMPAYITILLIPAIVAMFLTGSIGEPLRYFLVNLTFLNFLDPAITGMFGSNWSPAVNGALWTLKIEVMFYLCVPILAWMITKSGKAKWVFLGAIYLGAEVWRQSLTAGVAPLPARFEPYSLQLARQLPGQMSFFVSGIVLWMYWDVIRQNLSKLLSVSAFIFVLSSTIPELEVFRAAGLACILAFIAFVPGPKLDAARWGDMSYGVYITHFPIIQMLIALGVFAVSPILGIFASTGLVFGASFALWHLVEKRALLPSSHYRQKAIEKAIA